LGVFYFKPLDKGDLSIATSKHTGSFDPTVLKDALVAALDDNKAEDILIIPLAGKSALADYMVIASGRSAKHVTALASLASEAAAKLGAHCRFEGKSNGDWVLADTGDVILHIFRPEVRSFYNIEKIWCDRLDELPDVSDVVARAPRRTSAVVHA